MCLGNLSQKACGADGLPPTMDEIAAFTFIDDVNSQVRSFVDRSSSRPVRDVRLEAANAYGAQTGGVDRGGYEGDKKWTVKSVENFRGSDG